MSVIKITIKEKPFVCLSKDCLERIDLSWGARGLHSFLVSKPANWQIKISHLIKCSPQGKDAIYKLLNELVSAGYIKRVQERDRLTQKFKGYDYIVYEEPEEKQEDNAASGKSGCGPEVDHENPPETTVKIGPSSEHPQTEFPCTEKPYPAFPYPANPPLINIDINNNILNKNKAAASRTAQPTDFPQKSLFSPVANPVDIAAAALLETDLVIADDLTNRQLDYLNALVQQRYLALKENPQFKHLSFETIVHAIRFELTNPQKFKKAQQQFIRKLNTILAEAIKGHWQPEVPVARKIREPSAADYQRRALKIKIQCVEREREGFVHDLEQTKKNNPTAVHLIQSYQKSIAKYDEELVRLRVHFQALQHPSQPNHGAEQ